MHKTAIKLIVFDMGHVFIDFDWDNVVHGFKLKAAKQTIDFKQIMSFLSNLGYESGKITTPDFINELNQKSGLELDLHEFTQLWNSGFTENSQMAEILTNLKAKFGGTILDKLSLLIKFADEHFSNMQSKLNAQATTTLFNFTNIKAEKQPDRIFQQQGRERDKGIFY